jgi:hypothetical protein
MDAGIVTFSMAEEDVTQLRLQQLNGGGRCTRRRLATAVSQSWHLAPTGTLLCAMIRPIKLVRVTS